MHNKPIQIAVAGINSIYKTALAHFLGRQNRLTIVRQATNIMDLLTTDDFQTADVILLDLFPLKNNDSVISEIRKKYHSAKILVLSHLENPDTLEELMRMGASGYVSKNATPDHLLKAILSVSENTLYKDYVFASHESRHNNQLTSHDNPQVLLTEREKKIINLLWKEKSNKEIANEMFLGVKSIEKSRLDLKDKLKVKSTIGILKYALSTKIIEEVS